jgi:hypothetical protein
MLTILVIITFSFTTYFRFLNLIFFVGPFLFTHWFVWIGTIFIAVFTPIYYKLKRINPQKIRKLLQIHVFGNLFSFLLISFHFAVQVGRPPQFFPDLNTGVILYIVLLLLVASGFFHRFKIVKRVNPHLNRFIHISITLSFYLVIGVHILQGLNIL